MDNYGTIGGADAYHTARGNAAWTGADGVKLAALTRASAYVDGAALLKLPSGRIVTMFAGTKTGGTTQVLAWPRTNAYDADGVAFGPTLVPFQVEYATYEAALRELATPGSLSPDYVMAAVVKREKVDVLETEYAVDSSAGNANVKPVLSVVVDLLGPLFATGYCDADVLVV